MSIPTHRINLAEELRLHVPAGDDLQAATALTNEVVGRALSLLDELQTLGSQHRDSAPISSNYALALGINFALATLDWIDQWPG